MTNLSQDNLYTVIRRAVMWHKTTSFWSEFIGKWPYCWVC